MYKDYVYTNRMYQYLCIKYVAHTHTYVATNNEMRSFQLFNKYRSMERSQLYIPCTGSSFNHSVSRFGFCNLWL